MRQAALFIHLRKKFKKSVVKNKEIKNVPIAVEVEGTSPSAFDKDHFRYGNDDLNYFRLYAGLMFNYENMIDGVQTLYINMEEGNPITLDDIARYTLISSDFFLLFPEKLTALRELLAKKRRGEF
jgi:hypothetical protein